MHTLRHESRGAGRWLSGCWWALSYHGLPRGRLPSSFRSRTLDGWRYSPLDQIDRDNVHRIWMVWSRGLAEPGRAVDSAPDAHSGARDTREAG